MPRKPIEWNKCIIYKIWQDDDFYVGSTTDFTNRKRSHKCSCKISNLKIYQTIREKGGWIAWQMTPLEEYKECKSQIEARIREEEWRVKIQANLNSQKCFGAETRQEYDTQYRQEHKEELSEKAKIYHQEHKEYLNKKAKEYAEKNKKEIAEKYQKNKEEILKKNIIYRNEHKEQIKLHQNQKFECKCGGKYTHGSKARHEKSIIHQIYLATI